MHGFPMGRAECPQALSADLRKRVVTMIEDGADLTDILDRAE